MTATESKSTALRPPLRLETGSIVTVRMQGHTHSPNQAEYFAPAVVLAQYNDPYGSIDILVWDSSAGNHFAHGYHARELASRGEGGEREMYELQSNIGRVLFSPEQFNDLTTAMELLQVELDLIKRSLMLTQEDVKKWAAQEAARASATTTQGSAPPKAASERK